MYTDNCLDQNLNVLREKLPEIYQWISSHHAQFLDFKKRLVRDESGSFDFQINSDQYLYGDNCYRVYEDWQPDDDVKGDSVSLVVGCGLGYGVMKILAKFPKNNKIIVVEPNPIFILLAFSVHDFREYMQSSKLVFVYPDEDSILTSFKNFDVYFLFGKIYFYLDKYCSDRSKIYSNFYNFCKRKLQDFTQGLTTLRKAQDSFYNNELANIARGNHLGNIAELKSSLADVPAVIFGAGPSFEDYACQINELQGKIFSATALQTLPALYGYGIVPDVVVAVDYTTTMRKVFEKFTDHVLSLLSEIPLLYSMQVDPELVSSYPGPKLPFWVHGALSKSRILNSNIPIVRAHGNVSVAIYDLLLLFGSSPIILCGQDFGWKDPKKCYASGHHRSKFQFTSQVYTTSNDKNDTIFSTLPYVTALRSMEELIGTSGVDTYNLYGGVCEIKGTIKVKPGYFDSAFSAEISPKISEFKSMFDSCSRFRPVKKIQIKSPFIVPKLRKFFAKLDSHRKAKTVDHHGIQCLLQDVIKFLRTDAVIHPYIHNQILDLASFIHSGGLLQAEDVDSICNVLRLIIDKITYFDSVIRKA